MRKLLPLSAIFLVMGVAACSTMRISYDYDPQTDFSNRKTFGWYPVPGQEQEDELVIKQVKSEVNQQLESKGLKWEPEKPDFMIVIHGGKVSKVDIVDWGYSYGGPGRYGRYGPYSTSRRIDVHEYEEGSLILDFVNAESKELIWRGTATDALEPNDTPDERRKQIHEAVTKILRKYPPQQ
jgi:hypothetical protein